MSAKAQSARITTSMVNSLHGLHQMPEATCPGPWRLWDDRPAVPYWVV